MKDTEYLLSSEENRKRLQESIAQLEVSENIELCEEDAISLGDALENTLNVEDILATLAAPTLGFGCQKDISLEEVVWFCEEVKRLQSEFIKPSNSCGKHLAS